MFRSLLFASLACLPLAAQAQYSLGLRAHQAADRLTQVETEMSPRERAEIDQALERIEWILARYDEIGSGDYSCLSNGSSGIYEKFRLTDLASGQTLGGETSRETCQQLLRHKKNDLICLSNGSSGLYEKFRIYDLLSRKNWGGETALDTCLQSLNQGSRTFLCVSNGSSGIYEKFYLVNRLTGQRLGGETSLENCKASLPR